MSAMPPGNCPICTGQLNAPVALNGPIGDTVVNCRNCGKHPTDERALAFLAQYFQGSGDSRRAAIAHAVRKVPDGGRLSINMLITLTGRAELPPAQEVLDNLVMHLARVTRPGMRPPLRANQLLATVGVSADAELKWVVVEAERLDLIRAGDDRQDSQTGWSWSGVTLTMKGWDRHRALTRAGAGSRHAFMAMAFGDKQLQAIYRDHMRPAVAQTDFDLRTTADDHKTAGSIDNRMRVEIRTSRFAVCDLTHGNRGAYWEAGFAEGLGRPVFYTCRADVLGDRTHDDHPHFDTAHQLIIAWDPANPARGMAELKAAIRATLPEEARMEDQH